VSGLRTEITEVATALGTLAPDLATGLGAKPVELGNVTDEVWSRLVAAHQVGAHTAIRAKGTGYVHELVGHVEIRWSHGRFVGAPEAKVYLDSTHADVPGYYPLV
jgi:hypothetical protein